MICDINRLLEEAEQPSGKKNKKAIIYVDTIT